jgi:single-stranded DNA-binding protein
MNRVVLCGRLAGRPHLTYTPCGIPVAVFRLLVPRETTPPPREGPLDEIDCLVFRSLAIQAYTWGEGGVRVNLEGRLRSPERTEAGTKEGGLRVLVEHLYCADPEPRELAVSVVSISPGPPPALREERAA